MSKTYKKILPMVDDIKVVDQFGWLPLSVIEPDRKSKQKWKNAYLDDGIKEKRRSDTSEYLPGLGFSEFHAGVTENILSYWSMDESVVVDPFAGRATRAYVSSKLNRKYYGYEITPKTVKRVEEHLNEHNIELCGKNINRVLKPGGFCVWVCGDWREGGKFRSFHSDSIDLFEKAGLITHDIIIMKNKSPFAAMQIGKVAAKRYTSKIHEYVLVFRKEGELEVNTDKIVKKTSDKFWG